jgi:hypothetical protein
VEINLVTPSLRESICNMALPTESMFYSRSLCFHVETPVNFKIYVSKMQSTLLYHITVH